MTRHERAERVLKYVILTVLTAAFTVDGRRLCAVRLRHCVRQVAAASGSKLGDQREILKPPRPLAAAGYLVHRHAVPLHVAFIVTAAG